MAADINDKLRQATTTGTRPSPAVLTATKAIVAASISVDATTGWATETATDFVIYSIDANNDRVEGTQTEWVAIVNSATSITNMTLKAGTDQEYAIGSKVIATPTTPTTISSGGKKFLKEIRKDIKRASRWRGKDRRIRAKKINDKIDASEYGDEILEKLTPRQLKIIGRDGLATKKIEERKIYYIINPKQMLKKSLNFKKIEKNFSNKRVKFASENEVINF